MHLSYTTVCLTGIHDVMWLTDGRPRLQGELMLSRALGDAPYRSVGLTAEPEFTPWRSVKRGGDRIRVPPQEGSAIPCAHIVTCSLSEPCCRAQQPDPSAGDDCLILASDGLLERLSASEVCEIAAAVAEGRPPPPQPLQPPTIALGSVPLPAESPPPPPPSGFSRAAAASGGQESCKGDACVDCCLGARAPAYFAV